MSAVPAPPPSAPLADWLAYQEGLHPSAIELGLTRVRAVAQRLGLLDSPPLTLTVGGTNGKGSSSTLAALVYRQAGYRVGLYTSPHLLRYNERIVIDGTEAADERIVEAFEAIEAARGDIGLTYFEFGTLAALWLFRRAQVDVQVLEVGLGGRLDAVNIVDADAAIVTNIGLDHLDWLGPDRETIGVEKAGIFRSGRPAIVAERDPPRSVFTKASEIGAHVLALGAGYDYRADSESSWRWSGAGSQFDALPMPGLQGEAQLANAAGVIAALQALRDRLPVEAPDIRAALPALRLRGRFERIGDWIFDVAHNAESAEVLARNLASLRLPTRPRLLLGMLSDKPVETVLRILSKQVRQIDFVSLPPPRGLSADELRQRAEPLQLSAPSGECHASLDRAVRQCAPSSQGDITVVCGSFLTVAYAMQALQFDSTDDVRR
ncbi:bifunctional tetrahydrofolate synthase/dihydrofolate synthase [Hydrocarboniphaga effusa]|uniref:bifunctional tetrahydrofolate synthase/dihydrofolate synthase n=1 Tax=Hydrocarboniphaga effusa TaxID=243629 RepID=UPI003137EE92